MTDAQPFLLQMAGAPGTGKSRVAAAIAAAEPAIIINSDTVKSTLLRQGVTWDLAGRAAYHVLFELADDLLGQGHNVILDSPSHYAFIPANGQRVAEKHGARYRFLELTCADLGDRRRRLGERAPKRSQMLDLDTPPSDASAPSQATRIGTHQWEVAKPDVGVLILDAGPGVSPQHIALAALHHVRT